MNNKNDKELLTSMEERNILSAFQEFFGSDYISLIDSIIQSAFTLFFIISLDLSEDVRELFENKSYIQDNGKDK